MNEFELLRQLGARIAGEAEPQIDVSARVIGRIARTRTSVIDAPLSLVSICACALSALAILIVWSAAGPHQDSLASLSDAAVAQTGPDALLRVLEP